MRGWAFIIASIFLIVHTSCAYTQNGIVKENHPTINDLGQSPEEEYFVAKKGSILFHKSNCKILRAKGYVIDSEEIIVFKSREEAIKAHYIPCPLCKPNLYEGGIAGEAGNWFVFILGILGLSFLGSTSVSGSFSGGEGLSVGITSE
jgi:hypothetical protein